MKRLANDFTSSKVFLKRTSLKALLLFGVLLTPKEVFAQKKLNDPSIVAMQKRRVFESWGDFYPHPKYLLGIQTNLAYATVWGMWAPKRNQEYKEGGDLRPLRLGGLESQRLLSYELERKETQSILPHVESLYKASLENLEYHSAVSSSLDPLWLWYYKKMLSPIESFPLDPIKDKDWNLKKVGSLQSLRLSPAFPYLIKDLEKLKEQHHLSRTLDMPRGKRVLLYHKSLLELRQFEKRLAQEVLLLEWYGKTKAKLSPPMGT